MFWPGLIVGLSLAFYWGRVIKLVLKAKQRGESAHFFPPETLGRVIRVIWYPTVAVWVATPLVVALAHPTAAPFRLAYASPLIIWPAIIACLFFHYLTLICWRKMGREWRMGIDPSEQNNLLVTGPYAYVRHPIYALQQLLAIASAIAVPVPIMFACALLEVILLTWEAIREERHLTRVHGETYRGYMRTAGRFFPKRLPSAAR